MNPEFLHNFREHISTSVSNLLSSFNQVLAHETLNYSTIYKDFLKIIETFKTDVLHQIKPQLFPELLIQTTNNYYDSRPPSFRKQESTTTTKAEIAEASERKIIENTCLDMEKLTENLTALNKISQGNESNLLLPDFDKSNKDKMPNKISQFDRLHKHLEKIGNIEAPELNKYKSDDIVVSKHRSVLDESPKTSKFSSRRSIQEGTPDGTESMSATIKTDHENISISRLSLGEDKDKHNEKDPHHMRHKTDSFFRVFGTKSNPLKANFGERYRQTILNKQAEERATKRADHSERSLNKEEHHVTHENNKEKQTEKRNNFDFVNGYASAPVAQKETERMRLIKRKLRNIFMRKYFQRWERPVLVLNTQDYDDNEFDLLHEKVEGIDEISYLDISNRVSEEPKLSLRGIPTPLKLRDEIISSEYEHDNLLSGRLSFCDINFPETDRSPFAGGKFFDDKSLLEITQAVNETKPKALNDRVPMVQMSSPTASKNLRKPFATRSQFTSHEKAHGKIEEKDIGPNAMKILYTSASHKKENQNPDKLKLGLRSSLPKGTTGPIKAMLPLKSGFPLSNKENAFGGKMSPLKSLRKLSGHNKL